MLWAAICHRTYKVSKYIKTKFAIYLVNVYFNFIKQRICGQLNFKYPDNQRQIKS